MFYNYIIVTINPIIHISVIIFIFKINLFISLFKKHSMLPTQYQDLENAPLLIAAIVDPHQYHTR